jgi:hypothetical protein
VAVEDGFGEGEVLGVPEPDGCGEGAPLPLAWGVGEETGGPMPTPSECPEHATSSMNAPKTKALGLHNIRKLLDDRPDFLLR